MMGKCLFVLMVGFLCGAVDSEIDHGYLPFCPGASNPLLIADGFLNKHVFFVVQVHFPSFTYRKRYYFGKAIHGMGTDPNLDFKNRKTMVFLDGYMDTTNLNVVRAATGNYAAKGYNTIAIDCQYLNGFIYPIAARTNRQLGNLTATLLHGLMRYGLRAQDIEVAGLSLGGQTVSFVGKHFTRLSGQKVAKIIALDPSGPCFRNEVNEERLTPSDADFVQVIHTGSEGYGGGSAQGHVDFYVNGGEYQYILFPYQPWCDEFCSHVFSWGYYYLAFVKYEDQFVGVKCKNAKQARDHACYDNYPIETNVLGPKADVNKPGVYYVPVSADPPFFAPKDFIEKRLNYPLLYNDALSHLDNIEIS